MRKILISILLICSMLLSTGFATYHRTYQIYCKNLWLYMNKADREYMAQVVEAESNRIPGDIEARVYIAAVILNRVRSPYFRNTVRGVLDEPGQFTTTSGGHCYISATDDSRVAIDIAQERIYTREIPSNLLYFNSIGYNNGTAYDRIGGNYFMTYGSCWW